MKFIKRYWPDLLAIIITWGAACCCLQELKVARDEAMFLGFMQIISWLLLFPLIGAAWLVIRLIPLCHRLADRSRRLGIAVTLLPARRYLRSQLQLPALMAVLPSVGLAGIVIGAHVNFNTTLHYWDYDFRYEVFGFVFELTPLLWLAFGGVLYLIALSGLLHVLYWFSCGRQGLLNIMLPLYILPFLTTYLVLFSMTFNYRKSTLLVFALMALFLILRIRRLWRATCKIYYVFE